MTTSMTDTAAHTAPGLTALLTTAAGLRVRASNAAAQEFFAASAEQIARACQAMAARFQRGARLLVYGGPARRSDVAHVVVEFLHPVVVGKRALPAMAVDDDALATVGRKEDILLLLDDASPRGDQVVAQARRRGLLTLRLTGSTPARMADFPFAVPSSDACIVQETHEMLYHVLWELVHVFLDHRSPGA